MINKYLSKKCRYISNKFENISRRLYFDPLEKSSLQWHNNLGDLTLRLNYKDLNSNSHVFDIGGYQGQWASDIYAKYNCNIYIFEPVNKFYNFISARFENNNKIRVYPYGLSTSDYAANITLNGASSSTHTKKSNSSSEIAKFKNIKAFLNENNIPEVDLMKINIEGGEYDLIDFIIQNNLAFKIKNFQIQFHNFIDNYEAKRAKIREDLTKTHIETYCVDYIWENWALK